MVSSMLVYYILTSFLETLHLNIIFPQTYTEILVLLVYSLVLISTLRRLFNHYCLYVYWLTSSVLIFAVRSNSDWSIQNRRSKNRSKMQNMMKTVRPTTRYILYFYFWCGQHTIYTTLKSYIAKLYVLWICAFILWWRRIYFIRFRPNSSP